MIDWLKSLLSSVALPGVKSRRLVSVVVGVVLLAWLVASWLAQALVEIPLTVLGLLALCIGTVALGGKDA
jgi:hypothetical protein